MRALVCDSDASVPPAGGELSSARRDDVQAEDARRRSGGGESEDDSWPCPCTVALEEHTARQTSLVSCPLRMVLNNRKQCSLDMHALAQERELSAGLCGLRQGLG